MNAVLCALWLLQATLQPPPPVSLDTPTSTQQIDPIRSRASFTVHTRWLDAMTGKFESPTGTLDRLADGRLRVEISLQAASVAFPDSRRTTSWTQSESFFDVAHHPVIHFRSDPFFASRLRDGGMLEGVLDLRGVSRPVRFAIDPSGCQQPGATCPIHAAGTVSRSEFGMTRLRLLVRDDVDFAFVVRLRMSP